MLDLGQFSSTTKEMNPIGWPMGNPIRNILCGLQRHDKKCIFPPAVIQHFCCLSPLRLESKVLRLHFLHSTPIAVPISPAHPSQTAAELTQESRPTMWTGSQPGRLISKEKQEEEGTRRRALRNCLTFQVLLLFLAPH